MLQYLRSRHRRAVVTAVHADVVAHTVLGGAWWGGTHHGCSSALRRWPHAVRRRSYAHQTDRSFNTYLQTYQINLSRDRTSSIKTSAVELIITSLSFSDLLFPWSLLGNQKQIFSHSLQTMKHRLQTTNHHLRASAGALTY